MTEKTKRFVQQYKLKILRLNGFYELADELEAAYEKGFKSKTGRIVVAVPKEIREHILIVSGVLR